MPLHPQAQAFLDQLAVKNGPPIETLPVDEARKVSAELKELAGPPEPIAEVMNLEIPGFAGAILVRVYRPEKTGTLPAVLFFHGGGWVVGSVDAYDSPCRALANASGWAVVSVEYRLAPEHKFPAGLEDCYAAIRYIAERGEALRLDPGRLAVAGDSAGGNLAAAVCLMARDRAGPPIARQLLVYPVTDAAFDTPSYREFGEGYFLTRSEMVWFWNLYLGREADGRTPLAAVLRASELRGLPPALVVTAEYDPLRDEGEAYARRLREAGVLVEVKRYDGMMHGFFAFPALFDAGRELILEMASVLRQTFSALDRGAQ